MAKFVALCVLLLIVLFIEAAPHNGHKAAPQKHDSESESHEVETKETKESPEETEEEASEYAELDTEDHKRNKRDNLLRRLPLPETYGIPAYGNPDMKPFAEILAERGSIYESFDGEK